MNNLFGYTISVIINWNASERNTEPTFKNIFPFFTEKNLDKVYIILIHPAKLPFTSYENQKEKLIPLNKIKVTLNYSIAKDFHI